jgi:hypothetical protein
VLFLVLGCGDEGVFATSQQVRDTPVLTWRQQPSLSRRWFLLRHALSDASLCDVVILKNDCYRGEQMKKR